MRVICRNSYEQPNDYQQASVAIFCDVFRASTTLLTILGRLPARVILTNDEETARKFVREGAVLFSEVFGGGFDNSPTQARSVDIAGKVIVHKSTNLTNAIFHHPGFKRGFVGGFVNISAMVRYLRVNVIDAVEIVAASHFGRKTEAVEDLSCIRLISDHLILGPSNVIPRLDEIQEKISQKRLKGGYSEHYFSDVELALQLNEFRYLAEIKIIDQRSMELVRVDIEE
jgi:2-phosphosulfolactate phosphatase